MKLTVVFEQEAVVAILEPGQSFGEGMVKALARTVLELAIRGTQA